MLKKASCLDQERNNQNLVSEYPNGEQRYFSAFLRSTPFWCTSLVRRFNIQCCCKRRFPDVGDAALAMILPQCCAAHSCRTCKTQECRLLILMVHPLCCHNKACDKAIFTILFTLTVKFTVLLYHIFAEIVV